MRLLGIILIFILPNIVFGEWNVDFSRRTKEIRKKDYATPTEKQNKESVFDFLFTGGQPIHEYVILNTEHGFVPSTIRAKEGQQYRIHVVNVNEKEKNVSFVLDAFSEHHATYFGKIKSFIIHPQKEGVYSFQSPETSSQGRLVVYPRRRKGAKNLSIRAPAGEYFMAEASSVFIETLKNFLSPISEHLEDESVTEIMINGHKEIWIERKGKVQKTDAKFADEDSLRAAVNNIAQSVGRRINDEEPRLDARLPNGYRIHVVIPPCARNGTTVAIRKFSQTTVTFKDYINWKAMTIDAAQFLDISMKLGKNILVSGGTGSGKTTLLGVLCSRIPNGQRIIVIEDSTELTIDYNHVVFFETRMPDEQGDGEVTIRDLLKSSLRLRPDRIIVGEVRGAEALELIQAMNTGHKGCLGTVHANTAPDALVRLEALAQGSGSGLGEKALRHQIASALDLVVQVSRYSDGSRKVHTIDEVRGFNADGSYNVVSIYAMSRMKRQKDGTLIGQIEPTGELPAFMDEIEDNGIPFPKTKFNRPKAA